MGELLGAIDDPLLDWVSGPSWAGTPDLEWTGDIQPKTLHRARTVIKDGRAQTYLGKTDQAYRAELQQMWRWQARVRSPLEGELAVLFVFAGRDQERDALGRRRTNQRPDLSNLIKAVEDAGNGVLWVDDAQIRVELGLIAAWGDIARPQVKLKAWRLR